LDLRSTELCSRVATQMREKSVCLIIHYRRPSEIKPVRAIREMIAQFQLIEDPYNALPRRHFSSTKGARNNGDKRDDNAAENAEIGPSLVPAEPENRQAIEQVRKRD